MGKNIIFFSFILFFSYQSEAQKTKLQIAQNAVGKLRVSVEQKESLKNQLKIIGEGIQAIESAQNDRKTKNWSITWAIKSYLSSYEAILDTNEIKAEKYYELAIKALEKAKNLDKYEENSELVEISNYNIKVKKLIKANNYFLQNDFLNAFNAFKEVSDFLPKDTSLAINTALAALNLEKQDEALEYFKRAKENGIKNPMVFQQMAYLYKSKLENNKAIAVLKDGLAHHPNHLALNYTYINMLLDNEKYEKALKKIEELTFIDIKNKLLYYLLGYLQQEKFENNEAAEIAYKKSLSLDSNYFDALYQLSLVYIKNAGLALNRKDNAQFVYEINRSETSLLKAYNVNFNDVNTIKLLIEIYVRKNKLDKVQKLKRKLNEF